jgi:hypothetical protein
MEGQNMLTMLQAENATTDDERELDRFVRKVERILGVEFALVSDEAEICETYFRDGDTPEAAADEVRADWQAAADVRAEGRAERCLSPGYGS